MMTDLITVYPLNLAKSIFGSEEEARKVYLPGISAALATLTEREQGVIALRFQRKMTLEQSGKEYGITRERVRQIEAKAIRKLRHPSRTKMFQAIPLAEIQEQNTKYNELSREYERLSKAFELCTAKTTEPGVVVPMAELAMTMQTPIHELDLSVRAYNSLRRAGKDTLRDIVEMTEADISQIRNMGRKSAEEVMRKVESYGLSLKEVSE